MTTCSGNTDILCLGVLVADTVGVPIRKIPAWRQLELVDRVELHTGGCANNTGVGAARMGMKVGVIGKVGGDGFGDFIISTLKNEGVDTRGISRDEKVNTSFTFIMVAPDGERAFFHYIGANGTLSYEDVDFSLVSDSKILHVAGSFIMPGIDGEPTARVLEKARVSGVTTSLDTVWNDSIDAYKTLKPSLPHLDYFLPSIDEARLMTDLESHEEIADFFLDHGVGTVALRMGAEGCYIKNGSEEMTLPAFRIGVVDTSGAGDAWISGFLTGVVRGMSLRDAGMLGSATGALCVSAVGTTSGLRSFEETVEFMNNAEILK